MERKIGKRLISGVLALMLMLCCVPAPAIAEEETVPLEETETVTVTIQPEVELPEPQELFAGYADSVLYGYETSTYGTVARDRLNAVEKGFYDTLKGRIETVAANGGSTVFALSSVKGLKTSWTNAQLGVSSISNSIVERAFISQFSFGDLIDALLTDCPFDLYWYDKTQGVGMSYTITRSGYRHGTRTIMDSARVSNIRFSFTVTEDCSAGDHLVTTNVSRVQTARKTAFQVVEQNANKTNYEKLKAYKEFICRAVSYDYSAVNNSFTPYGAPWQMISVFDQDPSTNVVCEGYSKAFQYLCDLSWLDCITATGVTGGPHMWNVVTLDGRNYLVDVTNSDSGTIGQYGGLFLVGSTYRNGSYKFWVGGGYLTYTCDDLGLSTANYTVNHTCRDSVKDIPLRKASLVRNGIKPHIECENCGTYYTDKTCTTEAAKSAYTIPAVETVRLSSTKYSYDGKSHRPAVGVYDVKGKKLEKDKDFTVTYSSGRKAVGEYKVTIKGKGSYAFTKTLTFKILPPKTSISSLAGKTKAFVAAWTKKSTQVTGYQLQYSPYKDFSSSVKTVTISSSSTTSKKIKGLKSGKYYYVRVRTYKKTSSGKNIYSSWSDVKRVKTK